jgi:hypothetical protein
MNSSKPSAALLGRNAAYCCWLVNEMMEQKQTRLSLDAWEDGKLWKDEKGFPTEGKPEDHNVFLECRSC